MSLPFGDGAMVRPKDVIPLGKFSWYLYRGCKESSSDLFRDLSAEVGSLHIILKETEEYLAEIENLSPTRNSKLLILLEETKEVLEHLDRLWGNYEGLGTQAQRTWEQLKWGLDEVVQVREEITSNTTSLDVFNGGIAKVSPVHVDKKLNKFISEVQGGLREGSVISASTAVESIDSPDVWDQIRRELEDVGISAGAIEEHHEHITQWVKKAIIQGLYEEQEPEMVSIDDSHGSSAQSHMRRPVSIIDTREFEENAARIRSRTLSMTSLSSKQSTKGRKTSNVSTVVYKLFKKETAIIEAASDGDADKVAKLIRQGANVNARDRWGWSALSMCGYGGHAEVARILLDHGAQMDNIDVDGDTPETLALKRGHSEIIRILDAEKEARDLRAREEDDEKPRPVIVRRFTTE